MHLYFEFITGTAADWQDTFALVDCQGGKETCNAL